MTTHRWQDIKNRKGKLSAERVLAIEAEAEAEIRTFRALREELGLSQVMVAEMASMTQSEVSRFEKREDHKIGTMREMVEAVGGKLKVIAVVDGREIRIG